MSFLIGDLDDSRPTDYPLRMELSLLRWPTEYLPCDLLSLLPGTYISYFALKCIGLWLDYLLTDFILDFLFVAEFSCVVEGFDLTLLPGAPVVYALSPCTLLLIILAGKS